MSTRKFRHDDAQEKPLPQRQPLDELSLRRLQREDEIRARYAPDEAETEAFLASLAEAIEAAKAGEPTVAPTTRHLRLV